VDTANSALALEEITTARDALLLIGSAASPSAGVLIGSSTNAFAGVVAGLNVTVNDGTRSAVRLTVAPSTTSLTSAVQETVDAYNSIRETIDQTTVFNAEDLTTGILFGRNEPLRIESDLARIFSSRFFGVGQFQSLGAIGLSLTDSGKLEFDRAKFNAAVTEDAAAVESLFSDESLGLAAKLKAAVEQLAGATGSLLSSRGAALDATIESNHARIATMDARLERQRERLLLEFARVESVVADLRQSLTALASIQVLPSLAQQRTSSNSLLG
jgi:flagellar hook-associated protein 2